MRKYLTEEQLNNYLQNLKNQPVQKFWHSIGSYLWIDLGNIVSEEEIITNIKVGNEFKEKDRRISITYDCGISVAANWVIYKKDKEFLNILSTTDNELFKALDELTSMNLNLKEVKYSKSENIFIFDKDITIKFDGSEKDFFELSFKIKHEYVEFNRNLRPYINVG